jgi:hypothetical protein
MNLYKWQQLALPLRFRSGPQRKVRAAEGTALLKDRYLQGYGSKEENNRPIHWGKGEKVG